jgi:alpha-galactosidase
MDADRLVGYSDVRVIETPQPEVRFTSGTCVYTESLIDGRWVGQSWNPSGHVDFPGTGADESSFHLEIAGTRLDTGWEWVGTHEIDDPTERGRHHVVELVNTECPVGVAIHMLLDGTPVITRWLEITNSSDAVLPLNDVAAWCGNLWRSDGFLGRQEYTLGHFARFDWACEGWLEWNPIPAPNPMQDNRTIIRCDKGQGHDDPFFIVRNETKGEYFICHLAWSANWQMEFRRNIEHLGKSASLSFGIGPWSSMPHRVIAPGETIKTPAIHLGHVSGSLDTAVQAMHEHIRFTVLRQRPANRSYLTQLLVPCDQGYSTGDEFNESAVRNSIDVAADLGMEVFTLDAGWWDIVGDWYPSKTKFPNGLDPVREYIHEKGLLFGLYIEAEGGRGPIEQSVTGKEHPDWFGPKGVLNLSIPAAAEWMEAEICRVIDDYQPDLYRLDYNPQFTHESMSTPRDGYIENDYWRYYEAFYDIYERLREKYPNVIFQQCAAGGARNDLGTAGRFDETYLTDGLWMPHVLRVYAGLSLGLPPESLVVATGAPGWKGPLETYLRCTFSLSTPLIAFGPAPSLDDLNPHVRSAFRRHVRTYSEFIRPLLATCRMYHHAPASAHTGVGSGTWFAAEFASPDRTRGWATVVRLLPTAVDTTDPVGDTYVLKPRGLDPGCDYRVTFDSLNTTAVINGLHLMQDGLSLRLESALESELLLFEAI